MNVRVMLILNFHKQLRKSFKRDVVYWLKVARHELDTSVFEATVDYCMFRCAQAGSRAPQRAFPSDASPAELQTYLDERIEAWRSLYGAVLPCPVPEFVSNFKDEALRLLFRWFVDLQRHRRARMAEMTEHFRGDAEEARKCFRSAGKAMRTLPLAKLQVGHVAIDRTTLKHLLLHLRRNGEVISDLEIPNLKPVEVPRDENTGEPVAKRAKRSEAGGVEKQTRNRRQGEDDAEQTRIFWSHFPAAKRFLKGRKGAKLHPFLRTDGISCSVPLILPGRSAAKDEQKALKKLRNVCDLMEGNPPPREPQPGQRIVAIDPGRRDMITGLAYEDGRVEETFHISTREHVRDAKRSRVRSATLELQKRTMVLSELSPRQGGGEELRVELHAVLCHLPSNKAFETFLDYERRVLPIMEEALSAMSARRLRREAFLSYQSKDRALDKICRKICGEKWARSRSQPRVLVAFGNGGKVCTTGCGYAPAPQARLRHRLPHVWNARVSLINEYNTSKCCSFCGNVMRQIYKTRNKGAALRKPVLIYGVLRCDFHENPHKKYWHRDDNATRNIMKIYRQLAVEGTRPTYLRPPARSRFE